MTNADIQKKTLVQKVVPKPVRAAFRNMNFHFTEHGRVINQMAKTLPPEEKAEVKEHGKRLCVARSKKNFPRGVRNVASSLVIGQGMWYFFCPMLSEIPGIREHPAGWLAWGGADKLFLAADQLLYTTGGFSSEYAGRLASAAPQTMTFAVAMLVWEIAGDFSRCWIESWSQKKYGVVADGAARLYGQSRPFLVKYSAFEAYQKIISYALRPWTIGTPAQIYSSVHAVLGNLWRIGPQLLLVTTVGRAIDKFFKKVAAWTGLGKIGKGIKENAEKAEKEARERINEIIGPKKAMMLDYMLSADSRQTWKWRPFKPALSVESAEKAAEFTYRFEQLSAKVASEDRMRKEKDAFAANMEACLGEVTDIFGRRAMRKLPEYKAIRKVVNAEEWKTADAETVQKAYNDFSELLAKLRTERELS